MSRAVACRYDFVRAAEGLGALFRGDSGEAALDGAALMAWIVMAYLPQDDAQGPYEPPEMA